MSNLLFVVVMACVHAQYYTDENCLGKNEQQCRVASSPSCAWYNDYYGRRECLLPCNDNIFEKGWGNENDSVAYVDESSGSDTNDGSEHSPLRTIEQVKKCYGHNTRTILRGSGNYDLTPPANLSQITDDVIPFFSLEGDNPGEEDPSTTIAVNDADYDLLGISGEDRMSVICYVNKATFKMMYIKVDVQDTNRSFEHSTLLWMNGATSSATFEKVNFVGVDFPQHVLIHTGGILKLLSVKINPTNQSLPGNIIYWHGSAHPGTWIIDDFQIKGARENDIEYSYEGSLFEQVPDPDTACVLQINMSNSAFENIKWEVSSDSAGSKRQKNQVVREPIGLALTVKEGNSGKVRVFNTAFTRLDVSGVRFAAPLGIVSVPKGADPVLDTLNFTDNLGNSAGAISSNVDYSITGSTKFSGNRVVATDANGNVDRKKPPVAVDLGTALPADSPNLPKVNISDETLKNGPVNTDNKVSIAGEEPIDNKLPVYALAIIIAVGVVVVAAIVVIVVCAVYYRNKKYSSLSDEEYDESSSSSLRSSEKENEMDSA